INRAASIQDPTVVAGLDELIPFGNWKARLEEAECRAPGTLTPNERKTILVGAFTQSLAQLGGYAYVAETTILRPVRDRPLYCLCYASRHPRGIEVFRDCQIKALNEQSRTRAATKVKHAATTSGQGELFESLHDMGPDELASYFERERKDAEKTLLELTPKRPASVQYDKLWPEVLARHVVRRPDVNAIAASCARLGSYCFQIGKKGSVYHRLRTELSAHSSIWKPGGAKSELGIMSGPILSRGSARASRTVATQLQLSDT